MGRERDAAFFSKFDAVSLGPDQDRYVTDWTRDIEGTPRVVLRPRRVEEVAEIVRFCAERSIPVVPQGGHTGLVGGATPSADGAEVVVSLERLNRVREIDAANYTMIAEAGCTLQQVQSAADAENRQFPLRLGSQGTCQLGGNIATNAGGLNVLRYGMARDLVLGLEVVLPDGRIWNGLRKLRKNNTGYDLKQLFLGSEGTLGIVTAACLKLFPRPTQIETAILAVASAEHAVQLFNRARSDLSDLLTAFELMPRNCIELSIAAVPGQRDPLGQTSPYYVLLEATSSGRIELRAVMENFLSEALETVLITDGALANSTAQSTAFWRLREGINEAQAQRGLHLRTDVSIPISSVARFLSATHDALAAEEPDAYPLSYGHIGDGNIHFNAFAPGHYSDQQAYALFDRCQDIIFRKIDEEGGSISAEHGIGRAKREAFLDRIPELDLDLLRRVKSAIDPKNIMSPNRLL